MPSPFISLVPAKIEWKIIEIQTKSSISTFAALSFFPYEVMWILLLLLPYSFRVKKNHQFISSNLLLYHSMYIFKVKTRKTSINSENTYIMYHDNLTLLPETVQLFTWLFFGSRLLAYPHSPSLSIQPSNKVRFSFKKIVENKIPSRMHYCIAWIQITYLSITL